MLLVLVWLAALLVALLGTSFFLRRRRVEALSSSGPSSALRTCCVLGSGGHSTELLRLVGYLGAEYGDVAYVAAASDSTSLPRLRDAEAKRGRGFSLHTIPRSREVGQSYVSSVVTTLRSLAWSVAVVWRLRPSLLLVNGPGTCVPVVAAAVLRDLLTGSTCPVVLVESVCRVETLSLTGRLLYHSRLADRLIVQWPQLQKTFPRTLYLGRF